MEQVINRQRAFFRTDRTKDWRFRRKALDRLEQSIRHYEREIYQALNQDLHKSETESFMTEVGMTLSELSYIRNHLFIWTRKQYVPTPVSQFPGVSYTIREPYGVVLIMAPWNYPFLLAMEPLIGAIAAGNCCVVKPSAWAPATARVIRKILRSALPSCYVAVTEGGREENAPLLEQRFDYIFFTGGVSTGKLVMKKAAEHLTPVTLELGGKSPCIVTDSARLSLAARRLVFGKFLNSGQTCVAPDYVLVDEKKKEELLSWLVYWIRKMLGREPLKNPDYPKMINEKQYRRVLELIREQKVTCGGYGDPETLQITPTILESVSWDAPVMQEEIFGPVLPVLTYRTLDEAVENIRKREKPLALYLFTENRNERKMVLNRLSFGGGCINDTIIHLASSHLGFGGVGNSGMGSYHGKESFRTFSHAKSIMEKSTRVDVPMRYMPYTAQKERWIRLFLNGIRT